MYEVSPVEAYQPWTTSSVARDYPSTAPYGMPTAHSPTYMAQQSRAFPDNRPPSPPKHRIPPSRVVEASPWGRGSEYLQSPHRHPVPALDQDTSYRGARGGMRNIGTGGDDYNTSLNYDGMQTQRDIDDAHEQQYNYSMGSTDDHTNNYVRNPPSRRIGHRHQDSCDYAAPLVIPAAALHEHSLPRNSSILPNNASRSEAFNAGYTNTGRTALVDQSRAHEPLYHDPIDPNLIADDDDGFNVSRPSGRANDDSGLHTVIAGPIIGQHTGRLRAFGSRDPSGSYGKLASGTNVGEMPGEKSDWRENDNVERKRRKRIIWIIVAVVAVLAIAGGVVGAVLVSRHKSGTSTSSSSVTADSSHYTASSSQVKALMNNTNLHRVFPALDYTPLNTQYPACLTSPPSQNNVTLDMAVLSQLSPAIRLYGTDCNQTEMVLTAIDRLGLNSTMSVWLGVWLGSNATTNARQLSQMYDILAKYPTSHFKGLIVGNEVLFRKDLTLLELGTTLEDVRKNITSLGIDLPVATSDLGSDWTSQLVEYADIAMANVHPFFAGVTAEVAAAWTWEFWQQNDVAYTTGKSSVDGEPRNIISEVGWPSQGGNDCGTSTTCTSTTAGSVAGIDELNTFMDSWVCQAMTNGTEYFWFEAFDEPWKVVYDTKNDGWEDHWGLIDVDRNLKKGVKIPDCDGKTIS